MFYLIKGLRSIFKNYFTFAKFVYRPTPTFQKIRSPADNFFESSIVKNSNSSKLDQIVGAAGLTVVG